MRADYLEDEVSTIYFGGGTPSLLTKDQLKKLMDTIRNHYPLTPNPEITLEANPEDLTAAKPQILLDLGINRLSIGIQTFDNQELKWMNRAHDAADAVTSFANVRNAGFQNISLDLIYALPTMGNSTWKENLRKAAELQPEHISLYGLTIEDQTVFGKRKKKNELIEMPEDDAAEEYLAAISYLRELGYEHYEVSNFGKPGFYSQHNMAYWSGNAYLGVGPGAHSFDGSTRQFNLRSNPKYLKAIVNNDIFFEVEELTQTQRLNEQILTGLRRKSGILFSELKEQFHVDLRDTYHKILDNFDKQGLVSYSDDRLQLTSHGFLVADEIALQLFFQE